MNLKKTRILACTKFNNLSLNPNQILSLELDTL